MVSVSVIIVNYNARYFLKNCIGSVLSSNIVDSIEIIVVDNHSTDGSCEMLQSDFPQVICLENKANLGFSKANNRGVAAAKGKYVLILNPDTMLNEHSLSDILNFSEHQTGFGAAGVQFIDGSGKFLPESKRNFPNLKVAGAKLLGYSKYYYANHIEQDSIAEIDILTGAFMFIKREVYDEVGGFDEDFFMYGEDIDLSYRIAKAGFKNYYIGSSKVLHFKGECTIKDKFYLSNFYGALSIFYKKHFPNNATLYVFIDILIKAIISLKSISVPRSSKNQTNFDSWAYIGGDLRIYNKLKLALSSPKEFIREKVSNDISNVEIIFFDSNFLTFKEIIEMFSDPLLKNVKKRIIFHDHSFYLGSDNSNERGEVVQI